MSSISTCGICSGVIDLDSDGWREGGGGVDICADCVKAAESAQEDVIED